jgi:hypothetical protein
VQGKERYVSEKIETLRKLLAEATPGTLKAGACVVTSGDIAVACVRQGARLTCQRVECATLIAGRQRAFASLLAAAVNNLPALLDLAEAARLVVHGNAPGEPPARHSSMLVHHPECPRATDDTRPCDCGVFHRMLGVDGIIGALAALAKETP